MLYPSGAVPHSAFPALKSRNGGDLDEGDDSMSWEDREDTTIYKVVVNHEEQYSIWPAHRENPLGWNDVGKSGLKQECLDYIKEVWTDMRPLSLRKKMEEMERQRQAGQETN
jgi:MbtH protein